MRIKLNLNKKGYVGIHKWLQKVYERDLIDADIFTKLDNKPFHPENPDTNFDYGDWRTLRFIYDQIEALTSTEVRDYILHKLGATEIADLENPEVHRPLLTIYLALSHENVAYDEGSPSLIGNFLEAMMTLEKAERPLTQDLWIQENKNFIFVVGGVALVTATGLGVYLWSKHNAGTDEEKDVLDGDINNEVSPTGGNVQEELDKVLDLDNLSISKGGLFNQKLFNDLVPSAKSLKPIMRDGDLLNHVEFLEIKGADNLNLDIGLSLTGVNLELSGENPNQRLGLDLGLDGISVIFSVVS